MTESIGNNPNMQCPNTKQTEWKYIAIYYAIACGVSWTLWSPLIFGRHGLKLLEISPSFPVIVCIGTIGPLLACYITHRLQTGNWRAVKFLPRPKLRLMWLLLGPALVLFCFFVVYPALTSAGAPSAWHWHPAVLTGILIPMLNYNLFGGPLFEEFGWRGFLQDRMQNIVPSWIAALCVGVMWAAWHLPLFLLHPPWSSASVPIFFLILIGLSPVMAFGYNASGGSVVVAILMHSAFNASPRFLDGYLRSSPVRDHPSAVLLFAASFLVVGATLVLWTRGRLAAGPRDRSNLAPMKRLRHVQPGRRFSREEMNE